MTDTTQSGTYDSLTGKVAWSEPAAPKIEVKSMALSALCERIDEHWCCVDGPARAWFRFAGGSCPYSVYGFATFGRGPEIEQELCDALFDSLAGINRDGLLVYRRRPELLYCSVTNTTKLTVRLAFAGGETLSAPEDIKSLKAEAEPVPHLRPLLEDVSWLRGALYAAVSASGGDLSLGLDVVGRILKPEAQLSYAYEGDSLRLRTK